MSATPDEESLQKIKQKEMEMVTLFERPHKHPLVVPKVYECNLFFQMLMIIGCCLQLDKAVKTSVGLCT